MNRFPFLVIGLVFAVGCSGKSNKSTTTVTGLTLPQIDFELPGGTTSLGLLEKSADLLADTRTRVNDRITKLNEDMVKWNTEITEVGTFFGKGPTQIRSGALTKLTDDATYNYKLIICKDSHLHMVVKWSEGGKNVYSWRNQQHHNRCCA